MNSKNRSALRAGLLAMLCTWPLASWAQESPPASAPADAKKDATTAAVAPMEEKVIQLSPFKVTTDKDKGYRATNTTSGTRLNTAIKDLPMPIEVITEQFIKDTNARDLRQALSYSAGIQLQTQNDWSSPTDWASATPGRINNPEGVTSTADQSHVKIRGFQTESTLRDGFRRQNSTDSVNISRVEVIRGPAALLYGVGNFGGVVNYLVKQPEAKNDGSISASFGSYGFKRATLDFTGPINDTLGYRITGAYQDTKDHTDFAHENHFYVSPVLLWKPFSGTEILIDTEFGKQDRDGIGFQNLRAVPNGFVNDAAGYDGSFLNIPGRNIKEFRWSGPDTFNNSEAYNFLVKLTQRITDDLNFSVGANYSSFRYDQRDVSASIQNTSTSTPAWAIGTVVYSPLVTGQQGIPTGPRNATVGYQWNDSKENDKHKQIRADLTYTLKLFENASSKWMKMDNTFLIGLNYTNETHESSNFGTVYNRNNFKNPGDFSPFRFGFMPDGTPDTQMDDLTHRKDITQDAASYAIYQGKLLDNWVTFIAGIRKDRSWNKNWHYNPQWGANRTGHNQGSDLKPVAVYGTPSRDTTHQYGIDVRLIKDGSLSVFAMKSEASLPNYSGAKDFSGNLLQSSLGEDKEIGIKFDLFDGRVSGTVSKFQITRTRVGIGNPGGTWWAPTNPSNLTFNPNKNIVYQVNDLNPYNNGWNGAIVASKSQWDAAVAAGTVYQATNSANNTNWYVNASSSTGAALMDAVFANAVALKQTGWWGWIYSFDNLTNEATSDYNGGAPPGPTGGQSVPLGSDRSSGWDAQILLNPTDNLSVSLSWAHIEKKVLNASGWIKYPYPQDKWAIWYAPIDWADGGTPASQRYTDVSDTSTHISFGNGLALDDTPKNTGSAWVHYQMDKSSSLHGLSFGAGVIYTGSGSIYPAFNRIVRDANGNIVFLNTEAKKIYNGMARYEFKVRGREASVQLNIDNLANNTDYYGFIAQAPRKWTLTYSQKL
ncbi:MAG: TonB-dependent receptor plug domain-containing protein [Opitutae bacterium]|nr:TonB-dependent receptor plug domain-containing protein [Opitutae bacterium]